MSDCYPHLVNLSHDLQEIHRYLKSVIYSQQPNKYFKGNTQQNGRLKISQISWKINYTCRHD